jgi:hypothetical protein
LASQVLVVHERLGNWARHLRPRAAGWAARLVETRSTSDLEAALGGAPCPLVLIDVAQRPRAALDDLAVALLVAPEALTLVLNPLSLEGVAITARELGATHVVDGTIPPPAVAALLARWLPLAQRRAEAAGVDLEHPTPTEPEPWCWLPAPIVVPAANLGSPRG